MQWGFGFLIVLCAAPALAQDNGPINAERPGFSSSPIVLAPSAFQVESGYQYTHESGSADLDEHTLPLALFRVGLTRAVELQLGWAGYSWSEADGSSSSGANDASVGVKWRVNQETAAVPVALFAGVSLPVGSDEFSSDEVDLTLGAFWTHSASLDWFGTVLISDADTDTTFSSAVGISLPIADRTGAYVEYFGNFGGAGGPEHYLNGGFTVLPNYHLQLDVHAGLGLNGRARDLFIGLGIASRF